ncbi:TetR/AcrR family transcriptional regulator [Paenibacillus sp. MBLB2552]|uniref:TetR/AcrR family transcriptional regulator n=1 Tax=Paenibacillus mellifer TaxID=2937794 RepID=A0A9X2BNN3_9BACL|nr:TetR/AcrR family transcriptional regulator [Paenibacillus mellifer]MCK8487054.1 TetR/AcrR family transcriptional regulator [Paenibacillus mellifer]
METMFPSRETGQTKRRILEVAIELFSRNGYSGVSVREITKHVGIKESALYNHFKTKDEILQSIYQLFTNASEGNSLPTPEQLESILQHMDLDDFLRQGFEQFKGTIENPLLTQIWRILNIEQYRDQRAREVILTYIYKGTIDFLESAFQLLQQQKKIKDAYSPRMLAVEYQYPIFAMMTEYLLLKFDNKETDELQQRVEGHIQYFSDYVKL